MPDPTPKPRKARPEPGRAELAKAALRVMAANLASPFSDAKANEWAESAMLDYGAKGGDISKHAGLFGMAGAGGAVGGEAAISAIPVARVGASASRAARMGVRAAEGAVQNGAARAIGASLEGQSVREMLPSVGQSILTGGLIGGGVGGLGRKATSTDDLLKPPTTPMNPQAVSPLEYMRPVEDRFNPMGSRGVVGDISPKPDISPLLNLRARAGFANPTGRPVPPRLRETAVSGKRKADPFREWFGDSKAVAPDGTPQRMYHGTARDFDTFDLDKSGTGSGDASERAIFMSRYPDEASHYADVQGAGFMDDDPSAQNAGAVMPLFARAENPYVSQLKYYRTADVAKEIEEAKRLGHDSVEFPLIETPGERGALAVFDPRQVKSATGNSGKFDRNDPRITAGIAAVGASAALSNRDKKK